MQTLAESRIRRPRIPFRFDLELVGYTLLCYALPPERLRPWIPPDAALATRTWAGKTHGWLSIFLGYNRLRGIAGLPAFPVQFPLLNYRTYLETDNGHALYIFRSVIGSEALTRGARLYPQLPAESQPFRLDLDWNDDRLQGVEATVGRGGSELHVRVMRSGEAPDTHGFASPQEAVTFLGNVPDAFFPAGEDRLGLLYSPHPPLHPSGGRLLDARLPWAEENALLTAEEALLPDGIFLQGRADFPTFL
jgi:hypothetical protein